MCACCGEDTYEFLSIDHIDGGGYAHRKAIKRSGNPFYKWLKKNGYPPGYQVLCYNCNCGKRVLGYCPHEKSGSRLVTVDLGDVGEASQELNDLFG